MPAEVRRGVIYKYMLFMNLPIQGAKKKNGPRIEISSICPFSLRHETEEIKLSQSKEKPEQEESWKRGKEGSSLGIGVLCGQSVWATNETGLFGRCLHYWVPLQVHIQGEMGPRA